MPKSATFTLPSRRTITFWGLMSRWTMPRLWAWERPRMIWVMKCRDSRQFRRPRFSMYCLRVMPSMSSMTIYSVSPPRDTSYTETMLGWDSWATAWDSALKRRRKSSSWARSLLRIFTATRRLSRWHLAL